MDEVEIDKGAHILGSILSVPIYLVVMTFSMAIVYLVYTFFFGSSFYGASRLVELFAAIFSAGSGVFVASWACDKAFKSWSGWPVFVVLLVLGSLLSILAVFALILGYSDDWWYTILAIIQTVALLVSVWKVSVTKEGF
jgi:hypothetical protein